MASRIPTNGKGWVLYDGQCAFCISWVNRVRPVLERRGFQFATLQEPWVRDRLLLSDDAPLIEMVLLNHDGTRVGGGDAIIELSRSVWWAWPLFVAAQLPGARWFICKVYAQIASRRHCHVSQ